MVKIVKYICAPLLLGAAMLPTATAQTHAAITQDRDQAGRNYYSATASCNTVTFSYCSAVFPTPPAGKRLIITRVSILNLMPSANMISSIDLRYQNGSIIAFLNSQLNPNTSTTANYTTNEQVFAKFDNGDVPQLLTFISNSTNFQMVGIISGYMIDTP